MVPDTMFGSRCKKCGGCVDEAGICCVCHFDHYAAAENSAEKEMAEAVVVSAKKEVPDENSPIIIDDLSPSIDDDDIFPRIDDVFPRIDDIFPLNS